MDQFPDLSSLAATAAIAPQAPGRPMGTTLRVQPGQAPARLPGAEAAPPQSSWLSPKLVLGLAAGAGLLYWLMSDDDNMKKNAGPVVVDIEEPDAEQAAEAEAPDEDELCRSCQST